MILKLYYKIWIDAINAVIKKNDENQKDWKIILLIIFSVAQGVNLLTVFFWLNTFNIKYDIFFDFDFFPGDMLDGFLSGFITLFLPFILLNYFLIFRKRRYQDYREIYSGMNTQGRAFMLYFIISVLIFILPIIIGKWIL